MLTRSVLFLVFVASTLGLGATARAESSKPLGQAEHDAALELTRLVLSEEAYGAMIDQMFQQMLGALNQQGTKISPDISTKIKKATQEVVPYQEMLEWNIEIYGSRFTVDELHAMTAFYKTPVGRKMARLLPELGGEIGKKMGSILPQRLPAAFKKYGLTL